MIMKKGSHLTPEQKRKISVALMGHFVSDETKEKMSVAISNLPYERRLKISLSHTGLKESAEHRLSIKKSWEKDPERQRKENHWNWKGGITPIRKKLYFSEDYKNWRKSVFERDKYQCVSCGCVGNDLQADHIKPWSEYPEFRFDIDNGRTLCINCHKKTDTYGVHHVKT